MSNPVTTVDDRFSEDGAGPTTWDDTRVAGAWTHKWDGRWQYAVGKDCFHHRAGERVLEGEIFVFHVAPKKVFAFSEGSFSQTRHQF
jgi:hypothetical protein